MFSHHKLKVYDKALAFAAAAAALSADWPKVHAVADQLQRASESIVLNLVEGARLRSVPAKQRMLDYAIGSTLECAACLDIAWIKELLAASERTCQRHLLCAITKMLIGLRQSWDVPALREETLAYGAEQSDPETAPLFHHESLDVYQAALSFVRWFHALPAGKELRDRLCREIDKAGTSLVLNIAEGNGRHSDGDQRKFVEIAHASTGKAATYLDLCGCQTKWSEAVVRPGKDLLGRISAMLDRMSGN